MSTTRSCREEGCPYPAAPRRQLCGWHWLAKQPAAVQTAAARERYGAAPATMRVPRVPREHWPAGTRFCSGCCSFVPIFYVSGSRCKACASAAAHHSAIQKAYGISTRQYNAILAAQGGVCAICGRRPSKRRLAVDHDHHTGVVRGLLCASGDYGCNKGLGYFNDDVEILRRAVAYLETPPADAVLGQERAPVSA